MLSLSVNCLFHILSLLPVRMTGALGAGIGRLFYYLDKRHRHIALRNLSRIYPEQGQSWRRHIARESVAEMGRTLFEMPHVFLRSRAFLLSRIDYDGVDEAKSLIASGQSVIFTTCHHSNWELAAQTMALLDCPSDQIYRALRQQPLDILLKKWRERFGNTLHSRSENIRWLPKAIRSGHAVALMIDQHLSTGEPIPFLGHQANTTTLPTIFTIKKDIPVFAATLHRIGHQFRFRMEFRQVSFPPKTLHKQRDIIERTRMISDAFAPAIHARPELWLWVHRRWLYLDEQEDMAIHK